MTIRLSPLSDNDTVRLMSSLTKRPLMDAGLQRALVERSGGNPLYVCEFVCLAEEQGLARSPGGDEFPLPDSIASIISARLDLLDPEDKALLQAAAVVGRVFWAGALSFVEGLDPAEVQSRLRRLVGRELIRPVRRSSMQGQEEYAFAHVLARDGAYKRLTRADRARLHESTARWLEAVTGERAGDVAELLAHHLATAWDLAPSADNERRRRVYRFQMAAGDRARAFDAGRAVRFYRSAAALAATGSEKGRPLLDMAHPQNWQRRGNPARCLPRRWRHSPKATTTRDKPRQPHNWQRTSGTKVMPRKRIDGMSDRLELASSLEPSPVLARVLAPRPQAKQLRGKEDEALELVERAMAVAQAVGDTSSYARSLVIKGTAMAQLGEGDGLEDIREGLRIQLDRNDTARAMSTYNNAATLQIGFGKLDEGRKLIEEAIIYGTNRGLPAHVDWSRSTRNEALLQLGEWDECLKEADELVAEDAKRGGSQVGTFAKTTAAIHSLPTW